MLFLSVLLLASAEAATLKYHDNTQLTTSTGCNVHPKYWCSSPEVAQRCNVFDQCQAFGALPTAAPAVDVKLYYESLCPYCEQLISSQIWPVYQQIGNVFDLKLFPFGNAVEKEVGDHYEFTCQHGPDECDGNLIETCAIGLLKNVTSWLPYIACIEGDTALPKDAAPGCAKKLNIDQSAIDACVNGSQGNQLEHQMAVDTGKLDPPHQYVPWIMINGVHTKEMEDEAQHDLLKLICDNYTGTKPDACSQEIHVCLRD